LSAAEDGTVSGSSAGSPCRQRAGQLDELGGTPQIPPTSRERFGAHALQILACPGDDLLHRADRHLAVGRVSSFFVGSNVLLTARDLIRFGRIERAIEVLRLGIA